MTASGVAIDDLRFLIQPLKAAQKWTDRLQVVKHLRTVDAVRPYGSDVKSRSGQHPEARSEEIYPDSLPYPRKQGGRETSCRIDAEAGDRGRECEVRYSQEGNKERCKAC